MEDTNTNHDQQEAPAAKPRKAVRYLSVLMVVALAGLAGTLEFQRQESSKQLANLTERLAEQSPTVKRRAAQRVLQDLKKHIVMPEGIEPTVATITDAAALKERNAFYNNAEDGNHVIVTTSRAILYDSDRDLIVDVVPIRVQPIAEGGSDAGAGA